MHDTFVKLHFHFSSHKLVSFKIIVLYISSYSVKCYTVQNSALFWLIFKIICSVKTKNVTSNYSKSNPAIIYSLSSQINFLEIVSARLLLSRSLEQFHLRLSRAQFVSQPIKIYILSVIANSNFQSFTHFGPSS